MVSLFIKISNIKKQEKYYFLQKKKYRIPLPATPSPTGAAAPPPPSPIW